MLKPYRTIQDVLASPWAQEPQAERMERTDRVLRSTKLENNIYHDLRAEDTAMDEIERSAGEKLRSFPALSQDVFQSFYSLMPRRNNEEALSASARKFNAPILEHITQSEEYPTLKEVCEGRELPAYEAAAEFVSAAAEELDDLMRQLGGKKDAMNTLEKLEQAQEAAAQRLTELLEQYDASHPDDLSLNRDVIKAANEAESKRRQVEAVTKLIDDSAMQSKVAVGGIVHHALSAASEKAEEVQSIIGAWSDEPGDLQRTPANLTLLERVRASEPLRDVSRYLGRFREIFAQRKRNGYAYGRGEKYSLELGNDLSRALTSELAMLATPETLPLFLRKYQRRQIKQYRRREPIYKGAGDIICCLDESGSTRGDAAAWGKAVALTLLDIAAESRRKFALIHFAGSSECKVDVFLPGQYSMQDKMNAAETFLGGGTNFKQPLDEAIHLMDTGFENADIVFLTDGLCELPEDYLAKIHKEQTARKFTVTGILLDAGNPGMDFSLTPFCQKIYRTSELAGDEIVRGLVTQRM